MRTSIRVSDDTKRLSERLKRDDETFDELLERDELVVADDDFETDHLVDLMDVTNLDRET